MASNRASLGHEPIPSAPSMATAQLTKQDVSRLSENEARHHLAVLLPESSD